MPKKSAYTLSIPPTLPLARQNQNALEKPLLKKIFKKTSQKFVSSIKSSTFALAIRGVAQPG